MTSFMNKLIKAIDDAKIINQDERLVRGLTNTIQRPCKNE